MSMLDPWFKSELESETPHAMSRYAGVTVGVIEMCRAAYAAGQDLSRAVPGVSATEAAVIVVESLAADRLLNAPADVLVARPFGELDDWSLAVLAQMLFDLVQQLPDPPGPAPYRDLPQRAWSALEQALDSPTASPMLWYEEIFYDVAQEYWQRADPHALSLLKRGLAYNLHFHQGNNAEWFLSSLAEAQLWVGDLTQGLRFYTALLGSEPDNIWHYNSIAFMFCQAGLAGLGTQATERGLALLEATGDPEHLREQFEDALARLQACTEADRSQEVAAGVLAEFESALRLDFDAGRRVPYPELARELVPDLAEMPLKRRPTVPDLPAIRVRGTGGRSGKRTPVQGPSAPQWRLGRNDPCWCGSGKKYKHCHLEADRGR